MTIKDITAARISVLSDEDAGKVMKMIISRLVDGQPIDLDLSDAGRMVWEAIQAEFELSAIRAEAGRRGAETTNNPDIIRLKTNKQKAADKEALSDRFNTFWAAYPRHVGKAVALKSFEKINPDEELLAAMLTAINWQRYTRQWRENGGQYIPHPSTWLNQRRWEDEKPANAMSSGFNNPYANMLVAVVGGD